MASLTVQLMLGDFHTQSPTSSDTSIGRFIQLPQNALNNIFSYVISPGYCIARSTNHTPPENRGVDVIPGSYMYFVNCSRRDQLGILRTCSRISAPALKYLYTTSTFNIKIDFRKRHFLPLSLPTRIHPIQNLQIEISSLVKPFIAEHNGEVYPLAKRACAEPLGNLAVFSKSGTPRKHCLICMRHDHSEDDLSTFRRTPFFRELLLDFTDFETVTVKLQKKYKCTDTPPHGKGKRAPGQQTRLGEKLEQTMAKSVFGLANDFETTLGPHTAALVYMEEYMAGAYHLTFHPQRHLATLEETGGHDAATLVDVESEEDTDGSTIAGSHISMSSRERYGNTLREEARRMNEQVARFRRMIGRS